MPTAFALFNTCFGVSLVLSKHPPVTNYDLLSTVIFSRVPCFFQGLLFLQKNMQSK